MTTLIGTSTAADFTKIEKCENAGSQPACFTSPKIADFPQVPIGTGSPLFKLAVLISKGFVRLFGSDSFSPDLVEKADDYYSMEMPCCC